jgi:multidrug resistance efflux pump
LLLELDNLPHPNNEALEQAQQQIVEAQAEYEAQQELLAQLQEQLPLADAERRGKRTEALELGAEIKPG